MYDKINSSCYVQHIQQFLGYKLISCYNRCLSIYQYSLQQSLRDIQQQSLLEGVFTCLCYVLTLLLPGLTNPFFTWPLVFLWLINRVSSSEEKSDSEIIKLLFCILPKAIKRISLYHWRFVV